MDLSTQPEEHTSLRSSSKRVSFRRRVGSGSQASSPVSEGHALGRYLALNYAYNSPPSVNSLIIIISVFSSPSTPGETSIQLTGGIGGVAYDATSLHIFIREAFPGAVLLEEHQVCTMIAMLCQIMCMIDLTQGAMTYQLPSVDISWSSIFRQIENNKERLRIVDYSVSQTTLDQVMKG